MPEIGVPPEKEIDPEIFLDCEIDFGVLGTIPLRLTMVAHGGSLGVSDISARVHGKLVPIPELDLFCDALGIHLDPLLFGEVTAP